MNREKMEQEHSMLYDPQTQPAEKIHEALTRCKSCQHIVPKTMLCLYCGSPILYEHPITE